MGRRSWVRSILSLRMPLFVLLLIGNIGLVLKYGQDNRYLVGYSKKFLSADDSASRTTINALDHIRNNLSNDGEPRAFLSPILDLLRPPPREITERGGDCADRSRLLISLLRLHGIRASKVALYDKDQIPRHAVVIVDIENDAQMVVDPFYGLYFPRPGGGGYYSLADLTRDESILRSRIEHLVSLGVDDKIPKYSEFPYIEKYPYERYTYGQPRSINWDKSSAMRLLYGFLKTFLGEEVDLINRPFFVERPALMLLFGTVGIQLLILVSYVPGLNRFLLVPRVVRREELKMGIEP